MIFLYYTIYVILIRKSISIVSDDTIHVIPNTRQTNAGATVIFECKSLSNKEDIKWEKDTHDLVNQRDSLLILKNVTSLNNGQYTCITSNRRSMPAQLTIFEKPVFMNEMKSMKYRLNSRVELTCDVRAYPEASVEWKRDDKLIKIGRELVLDSIRIDQEGEYSCVAWNTLGRVESKGLITVYEKPSFNRILNNITIGIESKSLVIECNANGRPKPVIYWAKSNNQEMSNDDFIILDNGNLYIERLTRKYEGYYLCQASNEYGSIEMKTYVQIKSLNSLKPPPLILYGPQNQTIPVNTQVTLECKTSSSSLNAFNQIEWFKSSTNLRLTQAHINTRKYNLEESGSLVINSAQKSDSDLYRCQVTNSNGKTNSSWARLVVESPNNDLVRFQRNFDVSALPSVPSQPTSLTITSTSVQLTWQPSSHTGHSKLVGFSIEYFSPEWSPNVGGWTTLVDSIPPLANFFTVSDLAPNTYYMFVVRARNEQGWGAPSQVSDLIRTLAEIKANALFNQNEDILKLNDKVDILSSTSVNVTWTMLKVNFPFVGIQLKYRPIGSKDYRIDLIQDYRQKSLLISNLKKFTTYELVAETLSSTSSSTRSNTESNIIQFKTAEDKPSSAPLNLQVEYETHTSVAIKWEPPPASQMHGIIIGYVINCAANDSNLNIDLNTNASTRAIILGSLMADMKYCIKVAAQTSVGVGPFSETPQCVEMIDPTKSKSNDLPIKLQQIIYEPWFISLLIVITILTLVLFIYCIWNTCRFLIRKRHSKPVENVQKLDHGNRYNLVSTTGTTSDAPWLDTTLPSTNATTESYLVCESRAQEDVPTYAEIYSPNHYASTGLFHNSPPARATTLRAKLVKSQPNTPKVNRVALDTYDHLPPRPPPRVLIEQLQTTYNSPWNLTNPTTLSRFLSNSNTLSSAQQQYLISDDQNRIYKIIPLQPHDIPIIQQATTNTQQWLGENTQLNDTAIL